MSGVRTVIRQSKAAITASIISLATGAQATATDLTAGVILKEMPSKEFVAYVTGMVEGMAYGRFRKDTLAAGQKVETGMQCIRDWFHGDAKTILAVEDAFRKYADYTPWVVLGAMVKKECGE